MKLNFQQSFEAKALCAALAKLDYGHTISYVALSDVARTDVQKNRGPLLTARRHLLKEGFVFGVVTNVGLKRLYPHEIHEKTPSFVKSVRRSAAKHALELSTADTKGMTSTQQANHTRSLYQVAIVAQSVDKTVTKQLDSGTTKLTLDAEQALAIWGHK